MANDSEEIKVADPEIGVAAVNRTMEALLASADVEKAYGQPVEHEGRMVIPASEVLAGMGFGLGYGSGSETEAESGGKVLDQGQGGGGGGGGRTLSRPVAVIVADEKGVRVEPIIDLTKLGVTLLTSLGAMALAISRMVSKSKEM